MYRSVPHPTSPSQRRGASTPAVRTPAGTVIPGAEVRARRIAEEAEWWLDLATGETRMRPSTLRAKAFGACAFSAHHGTSSLAVPSKLVGTSKHQPALRFLSDEVALAAREGCDPWVQLDVHVTEDSVEVSHRGRALGTLLSKHEPWVRALIPFGLGVDLTRVTGSTRGFRLGCNVALVAVGGALRQRTLRQRPESSARGRTGGDGASVAAVSAVSPAASSAATTPARPASGAGTRRRVPVLPGHAALAGDPDDVVLWRTAGGDARASVPHVPRHSQTGIEWGYGGSGPADLARSVLLVLACDETADALYQRFKSEVVASVPTEGGVLRAADVRAWAAQAGDHQATRP